jgi:glutaredoxin
MEGKVIIYTTPDCPFCKAAKEDLQKRDIEYQEIDVAQNPEAEEKVMQLAGKRVVPVIIEGQKVTIGFKGV